MDERLKQLYDRLIQDGYELPEYDAFTQRVSNRQAAEKLYTTLSSDGYELPSSFDEFYTTINPPKDPSLVEYAAAGVGAFNRGIAQTLSAPLKLEGALEQSLGIRNPIQAIAESTGLVEEGAPWATRAGQAIEQGMEYLNPRYDNINQTYQGVGEGLGQAAGMIATAGASTATKGLQAATTVSGLIPVTGQAVKQVGQQMASLPGILGGAQTAVPEWEAAKEAGLSDDEAFEVLMKNYLVGQTEQIPIQNLLSRVNKITGGKLVETVKTMGVQALEEGLQEGVQTYLTNEIAKSDYDPDRDPLFQVLESAKIGGIVGLILPGAMSIASSLPAEKRVKLERKLGELSTDATIKDVADTGDPQLNSVIDQAAALPQETREIIEQPVIDEAVEQEQKEQEKAKKDAESIRKNEGQVQESGTARESSQDQGSKDLQQSQSEETSDSQEQITFDQSPEYQAADTKVKEVADQIRNIAPDQDITDLVNQLNEAKQGRDNARIAFEKANKPRQEKSVKMTPIEAIKHQVQTFYRGMEKGVKKGQKGTNELITKVQEAIKEAPLNSQQSSRILSKVKKTNLFTPGSVSRLNDFIDKVSTDARYAEDLSVSEDLKDRIKKKAKTKVESIPRNYKAVAKEFARIDPEDVDLAEYQAIANQVLGGFADPKSTNYTPINVNQVQTYINRTNEINKAKQIQRVRDEYGFEDEVSDEEIQQYFVDADEINDDEYTANKDEAKRKIIRDKVLRTAQFAQTGLDEVTSDENQSVIENLKKTPLDKLSDGQLIEYVRTTDNIIQNDDFSNSARIEAQIEAVNNAERLLKETKGKKGELGVVKGAVYNVPMMFNAIYSDSEKAANVQLYSGLQDVYNGGSRVEAAEHQLYEDFQKEAKRIKQKYGKTPLDAESQIKRGVFATLVRYPKGSDPNAVLAQSKNIVQESIRRLKRKKDREKLALDAEKAYNLFKNANTIDEVFQIMKKSDPASFEMWQFFNKEFETKVKGKLKKNAEQIFNEEFVEEDNYTPKSLEVVDSADTGDLDAQRAFTPDLPNKPKQAKTAIRATNSLPTGRALNFEFENNMFRKFRESMYDIETSKPRLLFREFMRLPAAAEILGGQDNKQSLSDTYRKSEEVQRGIGKDYSAASKFLDEATSALRTLGYTTALGSADQFIKQYIPVATNTIWNLGGDSGLFFAHIPEGSDNLFNMYTIGQRGRRMGGAERGEAIKYKIQSAYRGKALKFINKIHNLTEKGSHIFMYSLTKGDVSVAKRSWAAYYLKALKDKGVDLKTVDLAKEHELQNDPVRREAAAYAEQKVKETQVVSNPSELAKLLRTGPGAESWIKNIFIPFSTFAVNTKVRLIENIRQIRTNENKPEAYRALAGTVSEIALYSTIKYYLVAQIYDLIKAGIEDLFDLEGEEPDEEFRKKQWYSAILKDFLPTAIGTIGESISIDAANRIAYLLQNPGLSYEEWKKETGGGTFYHYKGTPSATDLGLYSVGVDRVIDAVKDTETTMTGDTTMSTPWGEKEVVLDPDQQQFMGFMTALDWLSVTGFMDAGFYNAMRKIKNQQLKPSSGGGSPQPHRRPRPRPRIYNQR
jgi:hypothetical protein